MDWLSFSYVPTVVTAILAVVWIAVYWKTAAIRHRQWLVKSLVTGLVVSAVSVWWTDQAYELPISWLTGWWPWLELWLLGGLALGLLSVAWLRFAIEGSATRPMRVRPMSILVSLAVVVVASTAAVLLDTLASLGLMFGFSLVGLFVISWRQRRYMISALLAAISVAMLAGASLIVGVLWPEYSQQQLFGLASLFDLATITVWGGFGLAFAPVVWWWLGQEYK